MYLLAVWDIPINGASSEKCVLYYSASQKNLKDKYCMQTKIRAPTRFTAHIRDYLS